MNDEDPEYVTRSECSKTSALILSKIDVIDSKIGNLAESTRRRETALFGNDGRGGMQKDITEIKTKLNNKKETSEISLKRLIIYAGLVSSVMASVTALIVVYLDHILV